jgi:ketosteroid isomerase-like protein
MAQYHHAAADFVRGNPEPYKKMFSQGDEVTLGNPFGPFVRGWRQAEQTMERAALNYKDGEVVGFETLAKLVTPGLAYVVEVERLRAKIGGRQDVTPVTLRATSVLRREGGRWKIVRRHADPISSAQALETIIR